MLYYNYIIIILFALDEEMFFFIINCLSWIDNQSNVKVRIGANVKFWPDFDTNILTKGVVLICKTTGSQEFM